MKNWSRHMLCGPPWISTNSGYFFAGSKPGGSATMLWIRRRAREVNQNSCTGCQSIAAARSTLNVVSGRQPAAGRCGDFRGFTALPQPAAMTGVLPSPPTEKPA